MHLGCIATLNAGIVGESVERLARQYPRIRFRIESGESPFFAFPPEARRMICTTNAIESVNARLRKIIKTRGHFPTDDAATKLIWLALRNITADWDRAGRDWKEAMNQFAILYDDRFTKQFT